MRSMMYLRPGNLFHEFSLEEINAAVNGNGRPVPEYSVNRDIVIRGILAEASEMQIEKFGQLGHPITHTIVQQGRRKAKEDDRLHLEDRTFLIRGVDEIGSLGVYTIYYAEERSDVQ